jgi:hypothetical protein
MSKQGDNIFEEIYFNGGLDTDSDDKFIKNGDYVDALNVIKVESGSGGIIVNMKGNESVYSSSDDDILCGWAYYRKNESIILFLYSDNETSGSVSVSSSVSSSVILYEGNKIVEFDPSTEASTIIIDDTILGFQDPRLNDYFIKADILDDWLAWTDNVNEPRMINIQNVKDGDFEINNINDIDLVRNPPMVAPTVTVGRDDALKINNLDRPFQFKYRFVYNDYRKSVYSSSSPIAVNRTLVFSQEDYTVPSVDNYIDVGFNSGQVNIRFVEIITKSGDNGNWGEIVRIDKDDPTNCHTGDGSFISSLSDDTDYFYRFYNNTANAGVDNTIATKAYDVVPEKSETLSFLSENRLSLGGNTSGKDLVPIDISLTAGYEEEPPVFTDVDIDSVTRDTILGLPTLTITFDFSFLSDWTLLPGATFVYDWQLQQTYTKAGVATISLDETVVFDTTYDTVSDIIDYIIANSSVPTVAGVTSSPTDWFINRDGDTITYEFRLSDPTDTFLGTETINTDDSVLYYKGYFSGNFDNAQGFSANKSHKLGIVYRDSHGRKYPVITSSDMEVYIESKGEATESGRAYIDFDLSSPTAPSDAVSYRFVYAFEPKVFIQLICCNVYDFDEDGTTKPNVLALDVSGRNNITYESNISIGDYIRVIKEGGVYGAPTTYLSDVKEFRIIDVKDTITRSTAEITGKWLIIQPSDESGYDYASTGVNSKFYNALLEIYTKPDVSPDTLYYEIGEGGTCSNGNHSPSTGSLNQGDIWYRPREFYVSSDAPVDDVENTIILIDDSKPYDAYASSANGLGDIDVEFQDSRVKFDNTILWSNKFFQDTKVNGLSTFDFDDKIDLSDSYGRIKGLEQLGDSLVAICEKKVLSSYVGATEYTDTQGNVNVVKSTTPLSYFRAHDEWYGTSLKESILNNGRYIYFYDLYNGCVVRKAKNGLFSMSGTINSIQGSYDYKMKSYFKNISDNLIETISINNVFDAKCYMGFDPYYENVYITFVDRQTPINNISLIYHEPSNRWVTTYSAYDSSNNVLTTHYPFTKKNLFHFNEGDGKLYKENSDTVDRCNLYGVQQEFYVKFTTHGAVNIMKIFNALGIHSDDVWEVESIEGDAGISYPNGVYSIIPASNFIREENVYKADFLRNMKTRSSVATNYDLINGDELRHYTLRIKLTNDNTNKVELFKVNINEELSR